MREALNIRRSFDGGRAIAKFDKLKMEAFYAQEVPPQFEVFDNISHSGPKFGGANLAFALPKKLGNLELYYYSYQRNNAKFQNAMGNENRNSLAFRSSIDNGRHFNHKFESYLSVWKYR